MSEKQTFVVGEIVAGVMQLDALGEGGRGDAYGVKLAANQPKRGIRVEGTSEGLAKFAGCLLEIDQTCDDAPASARRACRQAGERLLVRLGAKQGVRP